MNRKYRFLTYINYIIIATLVSIGFTQRELYGCFPSERLLKFITLLTDFGQRSEWTQYGKTDIGLFTSETMGYNLETNKIINYTKIQINMMSQKEYSRMVNILLLNVIVIV